MTKLFTTKTFLISLTHSVAYFICWMQPMCPKPFSVAAPSLNIEVLINVTLLFRSHMCWALRWGNYKRTSVLWLGPSLLRWKWRCIWHNSLLIGICFPLFTLKVSGMFRFLVSLHFPQILILSGPRHLFWRARLPYTPHFHAPSICVRSVSVDLRFLVNIHIV